MQAVFHWVRAESLEVQPVARNRSEFGQESGNTTHSSSVEVEEELKVIL
jgi:hypothetical protein